MITVSDYAAAFDNALVNVRESQGADWWPTNQPKTTALSWAIGLELAKGRKGRWVYSCWGSDTPLKSAVLDAYGVRYENLVAKNAPKQQRGRGVLFYPRQYLVDFSVYPTKGNDMLLALESEAHADHDVGSDEIDPDYDYNWDFAKLLYLRAEVRVFVARVRASKDRTQLWTDLKSIVANGTSAFVKDPPVAVYMLTTAKDEEQEVGVWTKNGWSREKLGTWQTAS